MALIKGVVTGIVVDVDDPNGEGRIRVDFPWMGGQNTLYWAPVATMMTGNGRGSWFMPEVGDEVLVAFEHEDAEHPFVLGFLWNGKDKPPETSSHRRLIKSVKGHTILLDDTDGNEKIEITTAGSAKIAMDDTSKSISIVTSGGQQVSMEDESLSITIKTEGTLTIEADQLTIEATTGVTVTAPLITLTGDVEVTGDVTVTGAVEMTGDVAVTGAVEMTGDVAVAGAVEVAGDVAVAGIITMDGLTVMVVP